MIAFHVNLREHISNIVLHGPYKGQEVDRRKNYKPITQTTSSLYIILLQFIDYHSVYQVMIVLNSQALQRELQLFEGSLITKFSDKIKRSFSVIILFCGSILFFFKMI